MSSSMIHRFFISNPSFLSVVTTTPLLSSSSLSSYRFLSTSTSTHSIRSSSSNKTSSIPPKPSSSPSNRPRPSSSSGIIPPSPALDLAMEQIQHPNTIIKNQIFNSQPKTRENYGPLSEFLKKKKSGELFKKEPHRYKKPIMTIPNKKPIEKIDSNPLSTATTFEHKYEPYRTVVAPEGIQINKKITKDAPPKSVDIRFSIRRTPSDRLPIYLMYNGSYTKVTTQLRGFTGDIDQLMSELVKLVGPAVKVEKKQGRIVIHGDHKYLVLRWLQALGF